MQSKETKHPSKSQPTLFTANPQQAAAIAHTNGPAAFIAAAGTGKTSILVQRLARRGAAHAIPPPTILWVTFTPAPPNEMEKPALKPLQPPRFTPTTLTPFPA